jgi:hypothetical protein
MPLWREKDNFIFLTKKNTDALLVVSKKVGLEINYEKTNIFSCPGSRLQGKINKDVAHISYEYVVNWRTAVTN